MSDAKTTIPDETKNVGGPIPTSLYWDFKRAQAAREETVNEALINAIRLYVDLKPGKEV
jgi:hypothetical protein